MRTTFGKKKKKMSLSQSVRKELGHIPRASSGNTPFGKELYPECWQNLCLGSSIMKPRDPQMTPNFSHFFFPFIFISWRLITLQYCSGFCHTLTWISHGFTCVSPSQSSLLPPSSPHPSESFQYTRLKHLSHASNLDWWSVSPLIVYLFQCYSLWTSHPRLLPQSLKVHLCLFFYFAYRVIITIFLNSIYMC